MSKTVGATTLIEVTLASLIEQFPPETVIMVSRLQLSKLMMNKITLKSTTPTKVQIIEHTPINGVQIEVLEGDKKGE